MVGNHDPDWVPRIIPKNCSYDDQVISCIFRLSISVYLSFPKNDDRSEVWKYRPLCVFFSFASLKLVNMGRYEKIFKYLPAQNFLSDRQSRFRNKRCTETFVLFLIEALLSSLKSSDEAIVMGYFQGCRHQMTLTG